MAKKKSSQFLVKFVKGTSQQYNSITPNSYTFYFLTDVHKIYLGDVQLSNINVMNRINAINQTLQNKATIQMKTKEEWNQTPSAISQLNTFYIYSNQYTKQDQNGNIINIPGVKVGDGLAYIVDLPFLDDLLYSHINDLNIHVTLDQKAFWNNKLNVNDSQEIIDGSLILNRQ